MVVGMPAGIILSCPYALEIGRKCHCFPLSRLSRGLDRQITPILEQQGLQLSLLSFRSDLFMIPVQQLIGGIRRSLLPQIQLCPSEDSLIVGQVIRLCLHISLLHGPIHIAFRLFSEPVSRLPGTVRRIFIFIIRDNGCVDRHRRGAFYLHASVAPVQKLSAFRHDLRSGMKLKLIVRQLSGNGNHASLCLSGKGSGTGCISSLIRNHSDPKAECRRTVCTQPDCQHIIRIADKTGSGIVCAAADERNTGLCCIQIQLPLISGNLCLIDSFKLQIQISVA